MLLLIWFVLALLPLAGVAWIATQTWITTVDGLFMSLILLSMSGIFGLTALAELRHRGLPGRAPAKMPSWGAGAAGIQRQRGVVDAVAFFEAPVGVPNKSVVTLRPDRGNGSRMLVFEGDLRNRLPVGRKVDLTYRPENGANQLLTSEYI